jgi:glutamine---fructose-6-phosphate transaminase (isomerizing)
MASESSAYAASAASGPLLARSAEDARRVVGSVGRRSGVELDFDDHREQCRRCLDVSAMRETMWRQPDDLQRVLADPGPAERAAERIAGRRVLLSGTGTSWHAANHGAALLRLAGLEAWAVQADESVLHGPAAGGDDALVLLSHRGTKHYTGEALARARAAGAATVQISSIGAPGADIETCEAERSSAFTSSHLCAIARLCQLAAALGASLGPLDDVPAAVQAELDDPALDVPPPARLLQYVGSGTNAWTAAEGALKVRETAYVAAAGYSMEYLLHGPSVAVGGEDALVSLDGGGPASERLAVVADACAGHGARVHRFRRDGLGEALSVFALTTIVQRMALEAAEQLGSDPDSFGKDLPGRAEIWAGIAL